MYKILAKVLSNRMRSAIESVISVNQSAFVKGRQILDGILVANEVVDDARKCKRELLLFKVDFEKAYDFIDWTYLDEVMQKMGFSVLWRKWIKECIGTTTASVLVNGSPTDEFPLKRGLRQGDPLSPFLFLLAAEGFNILMKSMSANQFFHGYKVGSDATTVVSHLQFADDTLIIAEKSWANVRAMRAVLMLFEEISGLKEVGGLGVRRIREFNSALLGKWSWMVLVEKESLWYRVLVARYGEEGGRLLDGGRTASAWWRAIATLHSEAWFGTNVKRSVGNGENIYFWSDVWVGGVSFKERFSRLFELSVDKWVSVFDLFHLGWGENGEAWKWRRRLFAWEEEQLGEKCLLLQNVILQVDKEDNWIWKLEKFNAYTVRSAYTCQSAQLSVVNPVELKLLWKKTVPLKVVVFAWRLL
ncbi:uncharacterized protein [Medicago truncatula]|uniref:uncharacterized protein n=1 Tax=Medicago truncatula TaxID=3880 RepID=UPI000D2F2211|nr:uncharacterized protein LOC112422002 [Medicago truncatula]